MEGTFYVPALWSVVGLVVSQVRGRSTTTVRWLRVTGLTAIVITVLWFVRPALDADDVRALGILLVAGAAIPAWLSSRPWVAAVLLAPLLVVYPPWVGVHWVFVPCLFVIGRRLPTLDQPAPEPREAAQIY